MSVVELSNDSVEAIARRVVEIQAERNGVVRSINPAAVYSTRDAADLLGIHPRTMQAKLMRGEIVGSARLGRWRVKGSDLIKAL